ncbi:hypothetical protein HDU82_000946 [Entophlyctis luteolus]|nr:hypothetical protein HDU82_000946 [Entophlyctis luteolus]
MSHIGIPPVPRSLETTVSIAQHRAQLEQLQQHAAPASPPPRDPLPLAPAQGVLEYAIMPDPEVAATRIAASSSMAIVGLSDAFSTESSRRDSVNSVEDVAAAVRRRRALPDEPSIVSRTSRASRRSTLNRPAQEVFRTIQFVKIDDPDFNKLSFKNNQTLNDANILTLIHALHANRHLKHLNLQNTHINDQHAVEIAAMLKENRGLEVLNLGDNYIGPNGVSSEFSVKEISRSLQVKAIVSSLAYNSTLRELKIGNQNPVPPVTGAGAVDVAFERAIASEVRASKSLLKLDYEFRDGHARGVVEKALARNSVTPTGGVPHLGNYLGALASWVSLQPPKASADHRVFYSVVDLHAITAPQDAAALRRNTIQMATALLAVGIDPARAVLFRQSRVPQHAELAWILFCRTPVAWLARMHQWKTKLEAMQAAGDASTSATIAESTLALIHGSGARAAAADEPIPESVSSSNISGPCLGLLGYPVLQAADILLYRTTEVPIGEDQIQHMNLTCDIAKSFNSQYKQSVFKVPKAVYASSTAKRIMSLRVPTSKMSKSDISDASRINITDSADAIVLKIKRATVDSTRGVTYDPTNRPGVSNLLRIHAGITALTNPDSEEASVEGCARLFAEYDNARLKKTVAERVVEGLSGVRERMELLTKDPRHVETVLEEGERQARQAAEETMAAVRRVNDNDGHIDLTLSQDFASIIQQSVPPTMADEAPTDLPHPCTALAAARVSCAYVSCPSSTVRINAPAAVAFKFLINPSTWPAWNSFVPRAQIISKEPSGAEIAVGTRMVFHVNLSGEAGGRLTTSPELVLEICEPSSQPTATATASCNNSRVWRVVWTSNFNLPSFIIATPIGRIQELEESDDGRSCVYRTWEPQTGIVARVMHWIMPHTLEDRFQQWAADLKRVAEKEAFQIVNPVQ